MYETEIPRRARSESIDMHNQRTRFCINYLNEGNRRIKESMMTGKAFVKNM
jgi:hypothetical protein